MFVAPGPVQPGLGHFRDVALSMSATALGEGSSCSLSVPGMAVPLFSVQVSWEELWADGSCWVLPCRWGGQSRLDQSSHTDPQGWELSWVGSSCTAHVVPVLTSSKLLKPPSERASLSSG